MKKARIFLMVGLLLLGFSSFGQNQNVVKGVLIDDATGEALGFATVSLTRDGQNKPAKYTLSDEKGTFSMSSVRNGSYAVVAELLGYEPFSKQITIESNKSVDLGEIRMKVDREQLEAAEVSAIGNPVIVKKDTIEYNAGSFLSTENDNLVDLLKKMPGIEVADNGTITVNGQSVSKITSRARPSSWTIRKSLRRTFPPSLSRNSRSSARSPNRPNSPASTTVRKRRSSTSA
jgi:hypothetical protein